MHTQHVTPNLIFLDLISSDLHTNGMWFIVGSDVVCKHQVIYKSACSLMEKWNAKSIGVFLWIFSLLLLVFSCSLWILIPASFIIYSLYGASNHQLFCFCLWACCNTGKSNWCIELAARTIPAIPFTLSYAPLLKNWQNQ